MAPENVSSPPAVVRQAAFGDGARCALFLFEGANVDTKGKYAITVIGIFLLAFFNEMIRSVPSPTRLLCSVAVALIHKVSSATSSPSFLVATDIAASSQQPHLGGAAESQELLHGWCRREYWATKSQSSLNTVR